MKKSKRWLAVFLAALMMLTPATEVYAANSTTVSVSENELIVDLVESETTEEVEDTVEEVIESEETTEEVSETVLEDSTEEAGETVVEEETEGIVSEEVTTEEATTEDVTTEEVITEEVTTEETTTEEITTEELTTEEETTTEVDEENWNGSGHKAPKLEMNLTSSMIAEKEALNGTVKQLERLAEKEQYVANEAIFLATSESYAEKVAEGYGATLDSFEEGVAVMSFEDDVTEIIAMAEDMDVKLPAVYPNYLYETCDDEVTLIDLESLENTVDGISKDYYIDYQTHHADIKTANAWAYNDKAGKGIKVAVIDSGVYKNHVELKGKTTALNTYATPWSGTEDNDGHGTHVSGIIAAKKDNNQGGAGVAYNASIISIKALESNPITGDCGGDTASIIKAVNTAVSKGARVINMSLSGNYYDALYEETINKAVNKGVVVVVAAGNGVWNASTKQNEGVQLSTNTSSLNYYSPACFENVITVSATNTGTTTKTTFSNYGNGIIDIAAPGTSIFSSYLKGYNYEWVDGTSQATPQVAAAAAYILSVSPDLVKNKTKATVDTVTQILKDSATKSGYSNTTNFGAGLLNVEAAVKMAAPSATNNTELKAPTVSVGGVAVTKNQVIQNTDQITLSSTLGDAANNNIKIYYTTNGKTPTENSTLYTGAFTLPASGKKTIKAVAVYYGKKSKVTTATVNVNAYVTGFAIGTKNGVNSVSSGKSLTLATSNFVPTYATNKKVTWAITKGAEYATINTKGVLKAKTGITTNQTVTVVATAQDRKTITASTNITIVPAATKLALTNPGDATCILTYPATKQMSVTATPAGINPPINYTSSNKKVATVDANGKITAVGAGKATITAKTADGSNKSCKMNVTVVKAVQEVKVTSKNGIYTTAAGKELQMVAAVTSDATNKKVDWSVTAVDGVSITSKGLLKSDVTKIKEVTTVTVTAKAQDEGGKSGSVTVKIYPAITSKVLMENGTSHSVGTKASGNLKTTVQLKPYTDNYTTGHVGRAKGSATASDLKNFTYKSSKTKVATVNERGLVTAVAPGTAKITITAKDGSNKKVTCTIKVVKPVTSITLYSKNGYNFVGRNKSLTLGATLNSDATNKKLSWSSSNTSVATVSNGKVKGKSYGSGTATAVITATATDGTGISKSFEVTVRPAITRLAYKTDYGYKTSNVYMNMPRKVYAGIESFAPTMVMEKYLGDADPHTYWDLIDYSSSNSNILQIVPDEEGYMSVYSVKKGTAYLTFKATDGSGKSIKLKVNVK